MKLCCVCYNLSVKIIGPSLQSTFFITLNFRAEFTTKKEIAGSFYIRPFYNYTSTSLLVESDAIHVICLPYLVMAETRLPFDYNTRNTSKWVAICIYC